MYEFWCEYVKPKYDEKGKLCCLDKDSFLVYTKRDDICKNIEEEVETSFDASNYELNKPLPKAKSNKDIGAIKMIWEEKSRTNIKD